VGPATGDRLRTFRLSVDLMAEIYTTEKLAEAFAKRDIAGARFCLPHGNLADPLLANHLREKGGKVEEWKLYDTTPETEDLTGARGRFLKEGAHWITFTSASTAENWHALQLQPAPDVPQPKAVSMGPVTSDALRRLGYEIAAEAAESTLDSLVATIRRLNIK
jgi:uroporphyrinogen III methyltransferase/synthase